MEPTKEQIQFVWEQCGLKPPHPNCSEDGHMSVPSGDGWFCLPVDLDLNNLFKYVVPFLQDKGYMVELFSYEHKGYKVKAYNITGQVDIPIAITKDDNPALALFWTIYKVLGGKDD